MDKTYQPQTIEPLWYERWEKANKFAPTGAGQPYCIMLPPPNVTGSLHMGHGFQHTLMDTLIRYHRMMSFNTLWQGGVDHAGIATQIVVEKQLEKQNISRKDLGREKFLEKVWEWKAQSGNMISQQMRRLGSSIDWTRERFTMDDGFSKAVNTAFKKLYDDKLIYKGTRLVNWDIKLQSAISDLEVITTEESGNLYYLKYYLDNTHYITVATTRPETLFGDVAVAVNPEDERYKNLIGQKVKLPLTSREIPIIADDYVEPEFGTGCVKITPAHDFNDYEVGKRHNLEMINIFNKNGTLNNNTPYENTDRLIARKQIIKDLENNNLLEKTEPYKIKTPRGEKTNEIIEPLLTEQWYIKMKPLAKPAIDAVKNGQIKFIPENWTKTYLQWLENIEDWCISRQLWWGHKIPIDGEEDVLDTWFSSALWPFATLGWPDKTPELNTFFPTSVLVTGFDIIFFWVARMIMFSLYFTGEVPFREVYITGLIRDEHGHKMSKSKGNVLDPIDLIDGISLENLIQKRTYGLMNPKMEKQITEHTQKEFPEGIPAFGTDALRFTFCALANTGRDIRFDLNRVAGYRNFCNKLWNATRFAISQTLSQEENIFDQWILSRLQEVIKLTHENFAQYRFDLVAQTLYEFTWYDYCDWYLEFSKIKPVKNLILILENILRLLHPIVPYITQEILHRLNSQPAKYPEYNINLINIPALEKINWLKSVVSSIRNIRSEMQISPSKKIDILFYQGNTQDKELVDEFNQEIRILSRAEKLNWTKVIPPRSAMAVLNELQIFIPLSEHIDLDAEIARIRKELLKQETELQKSQQKLDNPSYINKAPQEVVEKERERVQLCKQTIEKLTSQLNLLGNA